MNKLFITLSCLLAPVLMKAQLYNNYKITLSNSVVPAATMGDDFYIKAMELKRQRAAEYARQIEREKEMALNKTQATIAGIKELYQSTLSNYPSSLEDGWYNVISTNGYDFCEERQVYVKGQRITNYSVNSEERTISVSSEVEKWKAIVKLKESSDFLDLYFIEAFIKKYK